MRAKSSVKCADGEDVKVMLGIDGGDVGEIDRQESGRLQLWW